MTKKTVLFLDENNPVKCGLLTLGEKIRESGKKQLWGERNCKKLDVIVIHYISAVEKCANKPFGRDDILQIFCDYGVSSHYMINRYGKVLQLVPEEKKAWHCGGSIMPEPDMRTGVNDFSIGIELMATSESGFTRFQYRSLCKLCFDIEQRYGNRFSYVGHDQIAGKEAVEKGLRNDIKVDPGFRFDWERFFKCLEKLRNVN